MAVSTVNISFQEDLLKQIDSIARDEARTRSELIREAARIYIESKHFPRPGAFVKLRSVEGAADTESFPKGDVGVSLGCFD